MKRTAFDERRDQEIANEVGGSLLQCLACKTLTERETLSSYGGRCGTCYGVYLQQGKPWRPMPTREQQVATLERLRTAAKRLQTPTNPRAWAYALRDRENRGETLNQAQRDAWRRALHETAPSAEEIDHAA